MTTPCMSRRVGYQKWSTSVPITTIGNVLTANLTEFARLSLPSYPYPIKLIASTIYQNTAGAASTNLDAYLVIAPAGAVGAAVAALAGVNSHGEINIGGTSAEIPGRRMTTSFVLPADSGGDYIVGGWRETGSDAGSSIANVLAPGEFEAWR